MRISDFNHSDLESMKKSAHLLFKACCLFDQRVTPSLLTPCNVAPVNAEQCLKSYAFRLGYNTMEGREQKHQKISKYAENTTVQNRWPMIFRHEFILLIHLNGERTPAWNLISRSPNILKVSTSKLDYIIQLQKANSIYI